MTPTLERAVNAVSLVSVVVANLVLWSVVFSMLLPPVGGAR